MQWEALMASPRFVAAMGLEHLRQIEERVWATWPAPGDAAFVAEDAHGRPLGALILRVQERDGERVVGHRLAIAVELDARRQGIGRQLLEHAKRFSQAAGADYLLLQVDPSNEPALRAYLATGFQLGDAHGVAPMIVRFDAEANPSSP
jgi:ribosomal protein S18 acetylase RimI-like enzyme